MRIWYPSILYLKCYPSGNITLNLKKKFLAYKKVHNAHTIQRSTIYRMPDI